MKKYMMIGKIGHGKTTLSQQLHGMEIRYKKTQSVELVGDDTIDTPGEFLERKERYSALMVTAADADIIMLLCAATDTMCTFSPGMASMFAGKELIGVVTKTDLADEKQIKRAEFMLNFAGCQKIFKLSAFTGDGVEELKEYIGM